MKPVNTDACVLHDEISRHALISFDGTPGALKVRETCVGCGQAVGQSVMNSYRVYTFTLDGHITRCEIIECPDDDQAIMRAKQIVAGHDLELWLGAKFLGRFKPGDVGCGAQKWMAGEK